MRLRLSGKATEKSILENEIQKQVKFLLPQIKDEFVGYEEDDSIEMIIGKQLTAKGKTLAVAESCTGGQYCKIIYCKCWSISLF